MYVCMDKVMELDLIHFRNNNVRSTTATSGNCAESIGKERVRP
jgi:hypothetical protein